jgi:transposase
VCWVLMSFEPLSGWRELVVTERRRKREFAHSMRRLAEEHYPQAQKIRVVLDNLSTHTAAAFYENFPAEQARRLARRIEFVYTPVHGSWLNMVEIEISVLVSNASNAAFRTRRDWSGRPRRGAKSAIGQVRAWIGALALRKHASSSAVFTHQRKSDRGLGRWWLPPPGKPTIH